jgi:hypothetical protein
MVTKKQRQSKNKRKSLSRKKAGFWPFTSVPFPQQQGQLYPQQQGPPNLTGNFTSYEYGIPGIIGNKTYTNAQGRTLQQTTGIPQNLALLKFAMNPGATFSNAVGKPTGALMQPNYYITLGIPENFTPVQLQTAYNAKKNMGTNINKKLVQDAFNTLADPINRQQYDATMKAYYAANPPNAANIIQMMKQSGHSNPLFNAFTSQYRS